MAETNTNQGPYLLPSMLPSVKETYFKDTALFTEGNESLPSPADVRHAAGPKTNTNRPVPVVFPSLNLVVKFGGAITVAEGQCMWVLQAFTCHRTGSRSVWLVSGAGRYIYLYATGRGCHFGTGLGQT
jgi:hypothetical protein